MRVTREYLLSLSPRPCEDGLAAFDEAFPDGLLVEGEPDGETIDKLATLGLAWFATALPAEAWAAWERAVAEAWAAYDLVMAEARVSYRRAKAEAWAAYVRATDEARAAYDRAEAESGEAYRRAMAEAGAAYDRARAEALWRIVASLEVSS